MAIRASALGCTCIAAVAWFLGEGKTRWENRESRIMVAQCWIVGNAKWAFASQTGILLPAERMFR